MAVWCRRVLCWLLGLALAGPALAYHSWSPEMSSRWLTEPDAIWVADPSLGPDQAWTALLAADQGQTAPGLSSQAVWMRFELRNLAINQQTYYLNNENAILEELDLYLFSADGDLLKHLILGRNQPNLAERPAQTRFQGHIELVGQTQYQLLVRLRSDTPIALAVRVTPTAQLDAMERQHFATDWAMFAVLTTLLAFNLVLLFGRRDSTQGWLVAFHALLIVYVGSLQGFGHQFVPAQWVSWFSHHILMLNFIILLLLFRFALAFLSQGDPPPPNTLRYRYGLPAAQLVGAAASLIWPDRYIMALFVLSQLLVIVPILMFAWRQERAGYRPARLLMAALVVQVVGGGVGTLAFVGIWPVSDLALNAFFISTVIELLLMAFAVAARLRFLEERQHFLLLTDSATGLPGRPYIDQELAERWQSICRQLVEPVVLLVQLNGFRTLLQLLGPGLVQRLSVQALHYWNQGLNELDGVVSLPGYRKASLAVFAHDSFLVIVDQQQQTDLKARLAALSHLELEIDGQNFELESQVACFHVGTHQPEALDEILRRLNVALVSGHQQGHYFQSYSLEQDTVFQRRIGLAQALPQALQAGELSCHVQPVVDLHSGEVTGGEILLRWKSPVYGDVSPAEFIPLAEQMNRVSTLTRYVLAEVDRWQSDPRSPSWPLSVNLSVLDLIAEVDGRDLISCLDDIGLAPQRLKVEITETMVMEQTDRCLDTLERLRALGCALSIDDFGTGYSSLAYLSRIRPDEIKIDRAFIRALNASSTDRHIVTAIVQLSRTLGAVVVAEGVEDENTLALCRQLGCDRAQGYLIARPMPLNQLHGWLEQQSIIHIPQ
ncbi:EAL domain-containing protein [Saccharospirillum mangrovi]|uniref:EAL domain-containing protein n=1 Tax=Saccharospirillum mangrovi TaxID=2161747 RepID=UPI000D34577B|nr:EAL domain-containing protein [Saccharospirillum mangrovi]